VELAADARPRRGIALDDQPWDQLAGEPRLRGYHLYPATRADLLRRLGRLPEAAAAYREALGLVGTEPERAHLRRRLRSVEG